MNNTTPEPGKVCNYVDGNLRTLNNLFTKKDKIRFNYLINRLSLTAKIADIWFLGEAISPGQGLSLGWAFFGVQRGQAVASTKLNEEKPWGFTLRVEVGVSGECSR